MQSFTYEDIVIEPSPKPMYSDSLGTVKGSA